MASRSSQPSSEDVARLAGVSRTQVSYVLNGQKAQHVSAENRQKILDAAQVLGYSPQRSAQALARGYSNEFGLFFPAPYTFMINAMLGTIHEQGLADGCVPVQYSFNSYHDAVRKRVAFRDLLARKPRGLFCSLFDVTLEDVEEARQKGIRHIVLYDIEDHVGFPTLVLPLWELGNLAIQHLLFRGHRRIGMIKPADPVQERAYRVRWAGAVAASRAVQDVELVELPWPGTEVRPTPEGARLFFDQNDLRAMGITAIYTYTDEYALPILAELHDRGVSVPQQVAVLGNDDLPSGALVRPSLTSIRLDQDTLGQRAVAMINASILGSELDMVHRNPLVPRIVLRQTT